MATEIRYAGAIRGLLMSDAVPQISIAVMCYNEVESLREMVERTVRTLDGCGSRYDVLIVDDGSTDGSGPLADALAEEFPAVRALHHHPNKGIGAVLIAGYRETRGEITAILPADLQFAPEDLTQALAAMNDCDVLNITRPDRNDAFARKVISFIDRMLVYSLFGLNMRDLHWVKLYRRAILDQCEILSRTPLVDTELLIRSKRCGARMKELALPHHPRLRGEAKGAKIGTVIRSFIDLLKLRLKI
jgi:glycosyltransferase involved in cell wall biosynthesis